MLEGMMTLFASAYTSQPLSYTYILSYFNWMLWYLWLFGFYT